MSNDIPANVDPKRRGQGYHGLTGIFVRAKDGDRFVTVDIAELDKESLLAWLRSRGGDNPLAENTVGMLLDHGHLHDQHPSQIEGGGGG